MLAPRSYLFTAHHSNEGKNDRATKHKRKDTSPKRPPPTMSSTTTTTTSISPTELRPTTPSSPRVIPTRGHDDSHERPRTLKKDYQHERRKRTVHSPDALSPSVAALLAITQIPAQRSNTAPRTRTTTGQRLTVDAILQHTNVSEKEYSISLGRSPLDFLLCPQDELEDDLAGSETGQGSVMSSRTISSESMPSLDDDGGISEASPSVSSLVTPSSRGRRSLPSRRMQSLSLHTNKNPLDTHPLAPSPTLNIDELDFRVFDKKLRDQDDTKAETMEGQRITRPSAFKSNLTASLRAIRSAAKSLSSLSTPMITPDDFLTRSIISIDPRVPFTDERMPPLLEDTPTPALRRYLNPTTNAPIEAHVPPSLAQTMPATKCTASIQMETYKVSRSAKGVSPHVISRRTSLKEEAYTEVVPVARQREMRENSDFIRIAVMEMAMRRKGKLDDHKPGRAKWALPPRKVSTAAYEIGKDGIPVRWTAHAL